MNKYINKSKYNVLIFYNNEVVEVRPGAVISTKDTLTLSCLEHVIPKKKEKKEKNLNASTT